MIYISDNMEFTIQGTEFALLSTGVFIKFCNH